MKPAELYQREPIRSDSDLTVLFGCHFDHMPEAGAEYWRIEGVEMKSERLEIRYYKDHHYDGRRIWRLASVWFDGEPFMVIQNAGREGDDHAARFITNVEQYKQAVIYVKSLLPPAFGKVSDIVSADDDIPDLTEFYSDSLDRVSSVW